MKKMMALLMALLMTMVATIGAVGEAGTDLATLIEGTWDLTDVKGIPGEDEDQISAAMGMIKSMGGSITMTFHNGTVTMNMSFMGQSESEDSTYSISGNQIAFAGTTLECIISGDQMTLTDGTTSMVLTRSGSAQPAPQDQNSLIGSWKVIEDVILEGSTGTLMANIKEYFDAGNVFILTFEDNGQVTLKIEGGDGSMDDEASYVVNGNQVIIADEHTCTFNFDTLEGKFLMILVQDQDEMVLEYMGPAGEITNDPAPKDPTPVTSGVEGSWKITSVEGDMQGVEEFNMILQMGGVMIMTFENGKASLSVELLGQSQSQELGTYTDTGSALVMNGISDPYTIEGDTLTLTENGMTMVMVRQ